MSWQIRHTGSPKAIRDLSLEQVAEGLRDGLWEATDEVRGPGEESWTAIENHPQLAELAWEMDSPEPRHRDDATHLDMNALIDVCLVLLIFFILTTTHASVLQKVIKYDAHSNAKIITSADVKNRMIRLEAFADKAGKPNVRIENQPVAVLADDGESIDQARLRDALTPYTRGEGRKTEVLLDAQRISWGTVIAIQDAARSAGISNIRFLQKPPVKEESHSPRPK